MRLPYITEEPKKWFKLILKLTRSARSLVGYSLVANIIGAYAVTYLEFKEYAALREKLEKLDLEEFTDKK